MYVKIAKYFLSVQCYAWTEYKLTCVCVCVSRVLCSIVKELVAKLAASGRDDDTESVSSKCMYLGFCVCVGFCVV